ncbi:MAG: carbamoyl-phosphate synthase (glutamine-hydrolyzing) large subunit [Candidatus Saccharicenans sp.]|uniref:carbamoyl-phosphate synthase (glutamine-hydrolyzing) large subunit n=1 Tax=Candidatus Saccharicenans sp. TaxID=2819258 RepID=UPI0040499C6F
MKEVKKVLLLGSGAIKIGEAGEFDYSGSQAIKAIKEEGLEVVLVNPNIATIQTSEFLADRVYFLPVTPYFAEKIIEKEKPEAMMISFGGQTALNCGLKLWKEGVLDRYEVKILGPPLESVEITEDRGLFNRTLAEAALRTPQGEAVFSVEEGVRAAGRIGYPVMVRGAFALGGQGSSLCYKKEQLEEKLRLAFSELNQVLIEEYLEGWKEIEYEIVRDEADNCLAICNMENLDPMGIHTGESVVVAPSQTLTNRQYHRLREIAFRTVRKLEIIGECNIQFALNPENGDYRIIEVNARLSRSSALASKATGYPLAFMAAKLMLGHSLPELKNTVTRATTACFEPALDYVTVKIPRWDLKKFARVSKKIGSEMKSVGEVMAIGRSFEEALQKAIRMLQVGMYGFVGNENYSFKNLEKELAQPTDERLFGIAEAFKKGWSVEKVASLTRIDPWFLYKMKGLVELEKEIGKYTLDTLPARLLGEAKRKGFSDKQIAVFTGTSEVDVREKRKRLKIRPAVKQIDTLAAEYPARTNYLYLTYSGQEDDVKFRSAKKKIMVLGSGPYSIGSSVEFDWCCVNTVLTLRKLGYQTIMVNYNPETVSTDYDMCDRLYFDELSLERVLDIYEKERPAGAVISMGGQVPNNLALKLHQAGVRVLGTSPEGIDRAEDRHKFSKLLDDLQIDQPPWKEVTNIEEAKEFCRQVGYPVIIRPSYVLSGAAMSLVFEEKFLDSYLRRASLVSPEHPVVISKFIIGAKEIELEAVAVKGKVVASAIIEHIENAGVHSGDATMVVPPQKLYLETVRRIRIIGEKIARALNITGPFNLQLLAKDNQLKVIECNLRASRSLPFVSKVSRIPFIELAVKAMLGLPVHNSRSIFELNYVGVKAPQFSFSRLKGADPCLGVEMASTGEVACLGDDAQEALLKALLASGFKLPQKSILLSLGGEENKQKFLAAAQELAKTGLQIYATEGTSRFLKRHQIENTRLYKIHQPHQPNLKDYLIEKKIDFLISIPHTGKRIEFDSDYRMRRLAVDLGIPVITNLQLAEALVNALRLRRLEDLKIKAWHEYE